MQVQSYSLQYKIVNTPKGLHRKCTAGVERLAYGAKVWCPGERATKLGDVVPYRCVPAVQYT